MRLEEIDIDWRGLIERIETLLDLGEGLLRQRLATEDYEAQFFIDCKAFRWERTGESGTLRGIRVPDIPAYADFCGLDDVLTALRRNTLQFVRGYSANNVLLWGERGTGKSSLVRSLLGEFAANGLRLIEVLRDDLNQLPLICQQLRDQPYRFILYCDDLSFSAHDHSYRELKSILEGGLESRPDNLLIYATSNRRHLLPETFADSSTVCDIHPEESVAERLSLADRFGLSFSFYPLDQTDYLAIVHHLARRRELDYSCELLEQRALRWAMARGIRSGRTARQFIDDLCGELALRASGELAEFSSLA